MVHFTMFGGSEVKMSRETRVIITIFGGTEIYKPTLARRLLREKHVANPGSAGPPGALATMRHEMSAAQLRRNNIVLFTLFGSAEIKPPSLAEEFMDMRELVSSGLITKDQWDQLLARIHDKGDMDGISSFTLFGGLNESPLSDEEEIKKIRSAQELGLINSNEEQALRSVVGRDPEQVRMLLRETAFA